MGAKEKIIFCTPLEEFCNEYLYIPQIKLFIFTCDYVLTVLLEVLLLYDPVCPFVGQSVGTLVGWSIVV